MRKFLSFQFLAYQRRKCCEIFEKTANVIQPFLKKITHFSLQSFKIFLCLTRCSIKCTRNIKTFSVQFTFIIMTSLFLQIIMWKKKLLFSLTAPSSLFDHSIQSRNESIKCVFFVAVKPVIDCQFPLTVSFPSNFWVNFLICDSFQRHLCRWQFQLPPELKIDWNF